ncbi:Propeptide PepSY amd peptidase M4 [Methanocaldococcus sp. FS406-22]|uniref:PepSY domain-containing protein n=1 Tax=Methanocaldococcus sp. (strain FS406-22) TaxID=644281 RepID=UPI0001BF2FA5|nr:PepSY domain-containing protein [Methanocaldococcus sp. FS406-22]ADC69842.1 Propeptide PepSY amd peptidase M4 [Methanocaldococcus sp. FS406-22]
MGFKKLFAILLSIALLGVGGVFAATYSKNNTTLNSEISENSENVMLAKYTKITEKEAKNIALSKVPGKVVKVELENEDGYVVYGVEISTSNGIKDVKVNAENGKILKIDGDYNEKDSNDKEVDDDKNDNEINDDKANNDKETNDDNTQ